MKLKGGGGRKFCAIQCKFYKENHALQKSEINSFFTELGKDYFERGLFIDSTRVQWSTNAESTLSNQSKNVSRISIKDLESSNIDWSKYNPDKPTVFNKKHQLRSHQDKALRLVEKGFESADRGKLIMACGTGKTFTSLKIAEKLAGKGKRVLFTVPSISLMNQILTEWVIQSQTPIQAFSVCSDSSVGKRNKNKDDLDIQTHDLAYPATTDSYKLHSHANEIAKDSMQVVFCTYQSIQVVSEAQLNYQFPEFDLIICDEAHRTTGVILSSKEESNFTKIHRNENIKAKKRLYMTATPRLYSEKAKNKATKSEALLCSMDDEQTYGKVFHTLNFHNAVTQDLLTDYKVIVLAVNQEKVSDSLQALLSNENNSLKLDDATKLVGCYKALTKLDFQDKSIDPNPMQKVVAFCNTINNSKNLKDNFGQVARDYQNISNDNIVLDVETDHVDGSENSKSRNEKLSWLKQETPTNTCRILSNARCLSEGVDVPALDAIMFVHPRKSMVDVVQSVGRVMRKAPGKKLGYVILPVAVPSFTTPEEALSNNETYKVIWQVLNALRSHDQELDAEINKLDLKGKSNKLEIIGVGYEQDDTLNYSKSIDLSKQLKINFDDLKEHIYAKIVDKCGTRTFWGDWAKDTADIAKRNISRLNSIIKGKENVSKAFDKFLKTLKKQLNPGVTKDSAIEMLAQHIITKPVFEALFEGYNFTKLNPVSQSIEKILKTLESHNIENENTELEGFYNSVQTKIKGIENIEGKQTIILELYDNFFKNSFPKETDRLGIVYTPVEIVDFIIHSVNDVLVQEFDQTLASEKVNIMDPFTGTGTFITRLMQSGLIPSDKLENKFNEKLHANEIVLLAYYIASINIEQVYHDIVGGDYTSFSGICLTDTFNLSSKENSDILLGLEKNSERIEKQQKSDINVIIGNPPYSAGQKSANDNNQNMKYEHLDKRIENTYIKNASPGNKNSLYDSYIRAIRWASDRIKDKGIIGFVTNAGFIDSNSADGLRKCLNDEFSSLYLFDLKGAIRGKSGDNAKKAGANVFDIMTGVCISILVKNPNKKEKGKIFYHDIGDYLSKEEKIKKIVDFKSIKGIQAEEGFEIITTDEFNDWLNQRDTTFDKFIEIGNDYTKRNKAQTALFQNYSMGVKTNRDSWVYNFSKEELESNVNRMIDFYNQESLRYQNALKNGYNKAIKDFVNNDPTKISWSMELYKPLKNGKKLEFCESNITKSLYRPFSKQNLYFCSTLNNRRYQQPKIFPEKDLDNLVICISGKGSLKGFSVLIANCLPDHGFMETCQCFPLKLYSLNEKKSDDLFSISNDNLDKYTVKDGITDAGLKHFTQAFPYEHITKEDIFYYVYGLLHCRDYIKKYKNNLVKQLPRIPVVKTQENFWKISHIGRELANIHLNYETVEKYPLDISGIDMFMDDNPNHYKVTKMKFGKNKDKSTIIYNDKIMLSNIPKKAYEYIVNGKSPIEWVIDRQQIATDKNSKIENDANKYALETMKNPKYPLELIQRAITVSLETLKLIDRLPKLEVLEENNSL